MTVCLSPYCAERNQIVGQVRLQSSYALEVSCTLKRGTDGTERAGSSACFILYPWRLVCFRAFGAFYPSRRHENAGKGVGRDPGPLSSLIVIIKDLHSTRIAVYPGISAYANVPYVLVRPEFED